jgi:hypothetical protein
MGISSEPLPFVIASAPKQSIVTAQMDCFAASRLATTVWI